MKEHYWKSSKKKTIEWILIGLFIFCLIIFGFSEEQQTATPASAESKSNIKSVAILPFDNLTAEPDAGKRITTIFLTQLFSKTRSIRVIELGEVEKVLIEERVRNTGELDIDTAKKLGQRLNADYLILGAVVEYKFARLGNNDYPVIGVTARAIDAKSGDLIWSEHQYARGNQREKVFGIGRIISLSQLSELIVEKLVDSFDKKIRQEINKSK